MSPAFVCDQCETELQTGLTACPHCGQLFDTPVPDVTHYHETVSPSPAALAPHPMPIPQMPPPDHIGRTVTFAVVLILLLCLFWLGRNGAFGPHGGYLPSSVAHLRGH